MKFKRLGSVALASMLLMGAGSSAALAAEPEEVPTIPNSIEIIDPNSGPDFISDADMAEIVARSDAEGGLTFAGDSSARAAKAPVICHQDTGVVYKRSSGSGHLYGTVGAKPKITCTGGAAAHLALSTVVYKKVTLGYSKVAGAFVSKNWGESSLTQKTVEYICKTSKANHYRVIATGTVQYADSLPITASPYSDTQDKVTCG